MTLDAHQTLLDLLTDAFTEVRDADFAQRAVADTDADLFALGLNSLQAFDVLDRLVDEAGVDIDYADFTQHPTVGFLLAEGSAQSSDASVSS